MSDTETTQEQPSIEDLATHDYQLLLPQFAAQMEQVAGRKLKDVMAALAEYPLNEKQVHFSYPEQRELWEIGQKLFDCKFAIMRAVFNLSKDEINQLVNNINEGQALPTLGNDEATSASPEGEAQ